jgi:hypothetical protein
VRREEENPKRREGQSRSIPHRSALTVFIGTLKKKPPKNGRKEEEKKT